MAISILWLDGFDEIGNTNQKYKSAPEADPQNRSTYTSRSNTNAPFNYGRFSAVYNGYLSRTLPSPPYNTLFSAFHMWAGHISSNVSSRQIRFEFWNDSESAPQCYIALQLNDVTGKFDAILVRGSTDLYTWPNSIRFGQWQHVSIRALIDDTVGQVTLAVEGQNLGTFTGDTQDLVSSGADRFRLRYTVNDDRCFFVDNWIVATGLVTDPLLPVARVYGAVMPNANVQVYWIPNGGPNWDTVNEIPHDADSSYNQDNTFNPWYPDIFSNGSVPNLGTDVLAVKVSCMSRSLAIPYEKIQPVLRKSGINYWGIDQTQTNSYFSYGQIWQNDPVTGLPWTPEDALSVGFGYRRLDA